MNLPGYLRELVTDKDTDNDPKVTDGVFKMLLRKFAVWLNDFTEPSYRKKEVTFTGSQTPSLEELEGCYDAIRNSEVYYDARDLFRYFQAGNKLQPFEMEIVDRMITEYNSRYKSPLAKALNETK